MRFSADFTHLWLLALPPRYFLPPGVSQEAALELLQISTSCSPILPPAEPLTEGTFCPGRTYTNKPPVPETHFLPVPCTFTEAHKISVQDVLLLTCK